MKRFCLFRSNLASLEYYHEYKDLETFIKNCHDYYMLFPLWLLQKNYFDCIYIIRLQNKNQNMKDIIFDVNGKKYIQAWVNDLSDVLKLPSPDISFFRGGFEIYDKFTKKYPDFSKFKIYLGAGQRINTAWGGKYDLFLMEDDQDIKDNVGTHPFYKTASPFIFHPYQNTIVDFVYDICWPCNFTQINYKGQEFFIKAISKSEYLKTLKIVHCGNKPQIGEQLCKKYGVINITFQGTQERKNLNNFLNYSKFGLNLSNRKDGCPRVSTEILMSGTPLIIHEQTRLLSYYKHRGIIEVNGGNITIKISQAIDHHTRHKSDTLLAIKDELSFDKTNQKNIDLWNGLAKI